MCVYININKITSKMLDLTFGYYKILIFSNFLDNNSEFFVIKFQTVKLFLLHSLK